MRLRIGPTFFILLVLTACTNAAAVTLPLATVTSPSPIASTPSGSAATQPSNLDLLAAGEQRWHQSRITSYRIIVVDRTVWVEQTTTITVRNGTVVQQSAACQRPIVQSGPCRTSPLNAEEYTVPGLFALARSFSSEPGRITSLQLDPVYGFPSTIDSDIPHVYDIASQTQVTDFQVLP